MRPWIWSSYTQKNGNPFGTIIVGAYLQVLRKTLHTRNLPVKEK